AGDWKTRRVLADEPKQDHGGQKTAVANDEVRQRRDARQARPPDPRIAKVRHARDQWLPGEDVSAKARILRVVEDWPGEKGPRPWWRSVWVGRHEVRVVVVRLDLVGDQVRQVVELPAGEERVPGDDTEHDRRTTNGEAGQSTHR